MGTLMGQVQRCRGEHEYWPCARHCVRCYAFIEHLPCFRHCGCTYVKYFLLRTALQGGISSILQRLASKLEGFKHRFGARTQVIWFPKSILPPLPWQQVCWQIMWSRHEMESEVRGQRGHHLLLPPTPSPAELTSGTIFAPGGRSTALQG